MAKQKGNEYPGMEHDRGHPNNKVFKAKKALASGVKRPWKVWLYRKPATFALDIDQYNYPVVGRTMKTRDAAIAYIASQIITGKGRTARLFRWDGEWWVEENLKEKVNG